MTHGEAFSRIIKFVCLLTIDHRSSSSSCPCVEQIGEAPLPLRLPTAVQLKLAPQLDTGSAPVLRPKDLGPKDEEEDDEEDDEVEEEEGEGEETDCYYSGLSADKSLRLAKKALLRNTCRSAPSSPSRDSGLLSSPRRAVQSNEELEEWDVAPLINCKPHVRKIQYRV
jgi:hypothetical protein